MPKHSATSTTWDEAEASAPMARQFLQIKRQFPDAVVFFRLGDFYETFNEDAHLAAQVLNITLTSRKMAGEDRWPMAGVPHHAANSYLSRMVRAGYKCAIVEQMEEPSGKLVERAVTRVLTPGTLVEPNMLDARRNNYLTALVLEGETAGLAYCDVTTGEFSVTQLQGKDLLTQVRYELERLQPAEVLVADRGATRRPVRVQRHGGGETDPALAGLAYPFSPYPAWRFDFDTARQALLDHFKVGSLDGFGLGELRLAVRAAGAILAYVYETHLGAVGQLINLTSYTTARYMALDPATRRNLEIAQGTRSGTAAGSLLGVLDQTQTPMGSRLLRAWLSQPLLDPDAITARLDAVSAIYDNNMARGAVAERLKGLNDLERLTNRVIQRIATPRDLLAICKTLEAIPGLLRALGAGETEEPTPADIAPTSVGRLRSEEPTEVGTTGDVESRSKGEPTEVGATGNVEPASRDETAEDIWESLGRRNAAAEGDPPLPHEPHHEHRRRPVIRETHDARPSVDLTPFLPAPLAPCEGVVTLIRSAIVPEPPAALGTAGIIAAGFSAELDGIIHASRGAKDWVASLEARERERSGIKSLKVGFNKVFGYYLEVTKANAEAVPADYIRKQTLVNAERYITPELKEYETLILNAEERVIELETRLFRDLCEQIAADAPHLLGTARAIAYLDVVTSLAEVARRHDYVRPTITTDGCLDIRNGRHPVVERSLEGEFVANDLRLEEGEIVILTGPNMAGKSTFLRQSALIALMAQIGSFVPAESAALSVVDRIFTRIGAHDEIAQGQSTFMVEMVETANILRHATPRSLVILDEVGRGTSTYDGLSIAWAVVEYLHNNPDLRAKTLFATHYHELTELAERLPRVRNYNVAVAEDGDGVVFLHKIVTGGADRSYGIHVAQLAGLPRAVIHRASEILADLEQEARAPGAPRDTRPMQLALLMTEHPTVSALKELDVNQLTPLEAINVLYQLQKQAKE
ncbi:MAG: DNA mismatch repair protein MutS [Anaerolineae bacterium]